MFKDASRGESDPAMSAAVKGASRACYDAGTRDENTVPVG